MFDAAVVGAGPAGSPIARLLAKAGWSVALIEKNEFPRRKVCGEFLSATTLPVLEACGIETEYLAAAGPPVTQVGLYVRDAMLTSPNQVLWGRALGRATLDTLLRDAAVSAGVALFQPAIVTARTERGLLLEDGREIAARTIIAACGSWNAKGLFTLPHRPSPRDLFAFKAQFRGGALPPGLMPLLAFPGGYGGLVECENGLLSLSFCIRRDALAAARQRFGGKAGAAALAHLRMTTSGVDRALAGAMQEENFLSTGPIHPGIRPLIRDGMFAVGNLAGEAHPVIAEGISMAIQGSDLLAKLLIAGRAQDYPRAWQERFASRIRAASAFAHLAMSPGTRALGRILVGSYPAILEWGAHRSGKAAIAA